MAAFCCSKYGIKTFKWGRSASSWASLNAFVYAAKGLTAFSPAMTMTMSCSAAFINGVCANGVNKSSVCTFCSFVTKGVKSFSFVVDPGLAKDSMVVTSDDSNINNVLFHNASAGSSTVGTIAAAEDEPLEPVALEDTMASPSAPPPCNSL